MGGNPMFYVCLKIRITKVAFSFLDKWNSLIKNTVLIFVFNTNNQNAASKYYQLPNV